MGSSKLREEAASKAAVRVWGPVQPHSRKIMAFFPKGGESRTGSVIGGGERDRLPCWCQELHAKLKKTAGGEGEQPLHCAWGRAPAAGGLHGVEWGAAQPRV